MQLDVHHHENGLHFNSRPSARGDDCIRKVKNAFGVFQFTPLREGRPSCANFSGT